MKGDSMLTDVPDVTDADRERAATWWLEYFGHPIERNLRNVLAEEFARVREAARQEEE